MRNGPRLRARGRAIPAISLERSGDSASTSERAGAPPHSVPSPRMGVRVGIETLAARGVGALSRVAGRGGGTTLPGKLLWKLDPGSVDALAARLPPGIAVVSATNGKTTTTAMPARILGGDDPPRVEPVRRELALRDRLHAPRRRDVRSSACSRWTRVHSRRRPFGCSHASWHSANLFRDQLDRYGELEHIAERWRDADRGSPRRDDARRQRGRSAGRQASRTRVRTRFDSDWTTRVMRARRSSTLPTRSTAFAAARRTSTRPRTSATSATTAALPVGTRDRRSTLLHGRSSFVASLPRGSGLIARRHREIELGLPGLYNVYNATAAASLSLALGASLDEIGSASSAFSGAFGRFERIATGG